MNTPYNLRTLLVWALLPILCFACAIPLAKWFANENDIKTSLNYDSIAWGKIIASSPDVNFQSVDSIKYYGWERRQSMKKDSVVAADITHLFPDFEVKKLTIVDKGEANPVFEVWNQNGTDYIGWIARQKNGNFILRVNEATEGKIIPIGRFIGKMNYKQGNNLDLPTTTLNVSVLIAFALCLIGFGLVMTSVPRKTHLSWLGMVSYVCMSATGLYVILWITGWGNFFGSKYNYPEWIALAWLISEAGVLSGVLYHISDETNESETTKNSEENELLAK